MITRGAPRRGAQRRAEHPTPLSRTAGRALPPAPVYHDLCTTTGGRARDRRRRPSRRPLRGDGRGWGEGAGRGVEQSPQRTRARGEGPPLAARRGSDASLSLRGGRSPIRPARPSHHAPRSACPQDLWGPHAAPVPLQGRRRQLAPCLPTLPPPSPSHSSTIPTALARQLPVQRIEGKLGGQTLPPPTLVGPRRRRPPAPPTAAPATPISAQQ